MPFPPLLSAGMAKIEARSGSTRILGVWSPKGGVGKTTTAVNLASIVAEQGSSVVLVDADENESAADWVTRFPDNVTVQVATEHDPDRLGRLREVSGVDLVIIDLPGARKTGEARRLIGRGPGRERPVVDALLMPSQPSILDLRALARAIRSEVTPAEIPYRVVLTLVGPLKAQLENAANTRDDFRRDGWEVCSTLVRRYVSHVDAVAYDVPITLYGGRHSLARRGEDDYRALADEVFGPGLLNLPNWSTTMPERTTP